MTSQGHVSMVQVHLICAGESTGNGRVSAGGGDWRTRRLLVHAGEGGGRTRPVEGKGWSQPLLDPPPLAPEESPQTTGALREEDGRVEVVLVVGSSLSPSWESRVVWTQA